MIPELLLPTLTFAAKNIKDSGGIIQTIKGIIQTIKGFFMREECLPVMLVGFPQAAKIEDLNEMVYMQFVNVPIKAGTRRIKNGFAIILNSDAEQAKEGFTDFILGMGFKVPVGFKGVFEPVAPNYQIFCRKNGEIFLRVMAMRDGVSFNAGEVVAHLHVVKLSHRP